MLSNNYFKNKGIAITIFLFILTLNVCYIFYINPIIGRAMELSRQQEQFSVNDGNIRHCLTDHVLGRIPSTVEVEEFVPIFGRIDEKSTSRTESFKNVFNSRAWGKHSNTILSASGFGSTIEFTHEISGVLHKVISDLKKLKGPNSRISMLDVPCGDFAWMSRFLTSRDDIDYTGMDIVPDLIKHHQLTHPNRNWTFINRDIVVANNIGDYDVILCRMMMQHLFSNDIMRVLNVFSNNSNGILITTTFPKRGANSELPSATGGRFRHLNLEIPPFSLTPPICVAKDGPPSYVTDEFIGIWKLPLMRVSNCSSIQNFLMKKFNLIFYSCTNWIL